jgi:hypothetical protein
MLSTVFKHEDIAVLEDNLAFDLAIAGRANRKRNVIEKIGPNPSAHLDSFAHRDTARYARTTQLTMNTTHESTKRVANTTLSTPKSADEL